jgi:hypothetical protein
MQDRILGDREKALEETYFRQEDAKLLTRLRQYAKLDDIAVALSEKLQIDNIGLLERVKALGITADTASAFFLAPLIQVAWSDGSVTKNEHDKVLLLAHERGIEAGSPADAQLEEWLRIRPSDDIFGTAVDVWKNAFEVLPRVQREERINQVLDACQKVASASGKEVPTLLALGGTVISSEQVTIEAIKAQLSIGG